MVVVFGNRQASERLGWNLSHKYIANLPSTLGSGQAGSELAPYSQRIDTPNPFVLSAARSPCR